MNKRNTYEVIGSSTKPFIRNEGRLLRVNNRGVPLTPRAKGAEEGSSHQDLRQRAMWREPPNRRRMLSTNSDFAGGEPRE